MHANRRLSGTGVWATFGYTEESVDTGVDKVDQVSQLHMVLTTMPRRLSADSSHCRKYAGGGIHEACVVIDTSKNTAAIRLNSMDKSLMSQRVYNKGKSSHKFENHDGQSLRDSEGEGTDCKNKIRLPHAYIKLVDTLFFFFFFLFTKR